MYFQAPPSEPNTISASLTGTTAGSIAYQMPFRDSALKKFTAQASGYENNTAVDQTITFPTPFTNTPAVVANTTGLTISVTATTLTITAFNNATIYNGYISVEGI